jgi:urease accessory protein
MTPSRPLRALAALTLAATPAALFAHTGHDHALGLMQGLAHPVSGLDHLLAMVAVGLWAWRSGGAARWALPTAFVGLMLLGALGAVGGFPLPGVEAGIEGGILLSVVALGLFTAFGVRLQVVAGSLLVGLFGLFHGYAHGLEAGLPGSFIAYALGFAAATAALHVAGLITGRLLATPHAQRLAGAGVAAAGVALALV